MTVPVVVQNKPRVRHCTGTVPYAPRSFKILKCGLRLTVQEATAEQVVTLPLCDGCWLAMADASEWEDP